MRGNLFAILDVLIRVRSIPACAGEPFCPSSDSFHSAVYPRVCGGTWGGCRFAGRGVGLSPRVRGNRVLVDEARLVSGSIPACAGEPVTRPARRNGVRVYPRVCGGTGHSTSQAQRCAGLSPRVRGNHALPRPGLEQQGSIPACAGEPPAVDRHSRRSGVYPRVCGGTNPKGYAPLVYRGLSPRVRGTDASLAALSSNGGLSPRVRGNHEPAAGQGSGYRSIPACAGEPCVTDVAPLTTAVYPRVCGGTHACCPTWRALLRSIPACAGEPHGPPDSRGSPWVYPRVCGGTSRRESPKHTLRGLSPRVRGTSVIV